MLIETFLEKWRQTMRLKHSSCRTEQTHFPLIHRFIKFHGRQTYA